MRVSRRKSTSVKIEANESRQFLGHCIIRVVGIFPQVSTPNSEQTRKAKLVWAICRNRSDLFGQQTKLAVAVAARKLN